MCNKEIGPDEVSIQCEDCDEWFHPKCEGLVGKAFEAIVSFDLFWICHVCKN